MIVYFTGTGNSRFAAETLATALNDELLDAGTYIRTRECKELHSERPWVFAAPVYAWRMANVMTEFIRSVRLNGNKDAYFVLTCGGDIGNAGAYNAKLCEEKGLAYKGTLEVVMPENYVAMFSAPGEEESRAIVRKAKPLLEQGGALIGQGLPFPSAKVNFLKRLKSGPINEGFYKFYVKADAFFATDACIGCGACAAACPLNNIRYEEGKPVWDKNCTHCMACICGCPTKAIEYGKKSHGKPRYQCPRSEDL